MSRVLAEATAASGRGAQLQLLLEGFEVESARMVSPRGDF
jgi:hypothetical protein